MEADRPQDRRSQGCAQKKAAGKEPCGQIPEGPRPCGDRSRSTQQTMEADRRGRNEPEPGSLVSSAGSQPQNLASAPAWSRTAPGAIPGTRVLPALLCPGLPKSCCLRQPGLAAMAEIPSQRPHLQSFTQQCSLYLQVPTLHVGPTPSGLWLCT